MGDRSHIQWTDATWPVVAGCDKVSAGCRVCYAIRDSWRLSHHPNPKVSEVYAGTVAKSPGGKLNWTGLVRTLPQRLDWPLRWRKPRMVFVCNEADLFHPDVPDEFIDQVFAIMALCPQHTFQVLTKRPERMAEYMGDVEEIPRWVFIEGAAQRIHHVRTGEDPSLWLSVKLPLRNVWLGASCEDQAAADERIPHLLRTPAAVRFLSCEPLLGPIRLWKLTKGDYVAHQIGAEVYPLIGLYAIPDHDWDASGKIDWVIAGGESGPGARPCDVAWIRSLVEQCRAAGTAAFVKQLGARPIRTGPPCPLECQGSIHYGDFRDRKGGDPDEWCEDVQVREFPAPAGAEVERG